MNFPELLGVYDHLIVHCSATPASMDIGATEIDRMHRRKGWSRCGYHAVIRRDGTLEWELTGHRTRAIGSPGAHVGGCGSGWNARSFGICLIGGVKSDGRTPENNFIQQQLTTLGIFVAKATHNFGIPITNVIGHRDLIKQTNAAPKACPCFSVVEVRDDWVDLDHYDAHRLSYSWDRATRPAPQRGEKIKVPKTYTVQPNDTLWGLSRAFGVPLKDIRRLNSITGDMIQAGQKLRLLN